LQVPAGLAGICRRNNSSTDGDNRREFSGMRRSEIPSGYWNIFLRSADGKRPVYGGLKNFRTMLTGATAFIFTNSSKVTTAVDFLPWFRKRRSRPPSRRAAATFTLSAQT